MGDGRPRNGRDEADEQLNQFKARQRGRVETLTTGGGTPIADKLNSLTIGPRGPILLQDTVYIDEISHFDRERIPERVVHAKGAGAFGFFEVTNDISQYTRAKVFNEIGKRTPIAVRFSFVSGESGSADSSRDPRGFAIKFYTEEGIGICHRKNGQNILTLCQMRKFDHNFQSDQGIKNLSPEASRELAGTDPDYATRDLYNAIANGDYPSWTFYIQVMTFEQARTWRFNPFDVTKVWPQKEFPLIEVGKLVLNRNPKNYFAEVEQIAFTVSNLVPGIEASPDKMLQGRLFSYADTQRYRLGTNYLQLPVNCPYRVRPRNYQRDGEMTIYSQALAVLRMTEQLENHPLKCTEDVDRYDSSNEDNFTQAGIFYREVLDDDQRARLVRNIAENLVEAQEFIQARAVKNFAEADPDYGRRVADELKRLKLERWEEMERSHPRGRLTLNGQKSKNFASSQFKTQAYVKSAY
ncbi:Catalase like protein [Argiope bruennichi]|uniref:Catalase n=1 Tax=Argiope bruennichi TaxID=94029 RepID=A0A8T0EJ34_ARGBR|nr:Catalase like protein [Argiope bruennichi]